MERLFAKHLKRRREDLARVIKQYSRERKQNSDQQRKGLSFPLWRGWALLVYTTVLRVALAIVAL